MGSSSKSESGFFQTTVGALIFTPMRYFSGAIGVSQRIRLKTPGEMRSIIGMRTWKTAIFALSWV